MSRAAEVKPSWDNLPLSPANLQLGKINSKKIMIKKPSQNFESILNKTAMQLPKPIIKLSSLPKKAQI